MPMQDTHGMTLAGWSQTLFSGFLPTFVTVYAGPAAGSP